MKKIPTLYRSIISRMLQDYQNELMVRAEHLIQSEGQIPLNAQILQKKLRISYLNASKVVYRLKNEGIRQQLTYK